MGNPTTTTTLPTTSDLREQIVEAIVDRTERIAAVRVRIAQLTTVAADTAALGLLTRQTAAVVDGIEVAIAGLEDILDSLYAARSDLAACLAER